MIKKQYDVFISHSSEDKNDLVRELANKLIERGYTVWYDEFTLFVGDGLRKSIDLGISNSRFGIIVLSKSFFKKGWTNYELDGLVQINLESPGIILPIWHKIGQSEVANYSLPISNIVAISSLGKNIQQIVDQLERKIGEYEYEVDNDGNIYRQRNKKSIDKNRRKSGFQVIKSIQTDHLINDKESNSRYDVTIYPYSMDFNEHEFQYWQNEPGELKLIRHIVYDIDNEEILESKNTISKNDGTHLISRVKFKRKTNSPLKIVCDVRATNCFKGIFDDGYEYVEFNNKSKIDFFEHIFIIPDTKQFEQVKSYINDKLINPKNKPGNKIFNHVLRDVKPKTTLRYSLINENIRYKNK